MWHDGSIDNSLCLHDSSSEPLVLTPPYLTTYNIIRNITYMYMYIVDVHVHLYKCTVRTAWQEVFVLVHFCKFRSLAKLIFFISSVHATLHNHACSLIKFYGTIRKMFVTGIYTCIYIYIYMCMYTKLCAYRYAQSHQN